jgi:hypothetical protein
MRETGVWELTRHFFGRFFENDVVQPRGDTVTTVVRALAIVAAPGLMFAFFLQNQYPQRTRWGRIEDEYFFVMFSFVAMAGVAIFQWETLFPDRLDFLVLTPLSLQRWEMPVAKASALAMFLGLFLGAANIFGVLMLPAVAKGHFWRQLAAQAVATTSAGVFGALSVMLLGGVLICVLPSALFRSVSLIFRMLTVAALGLFVIHYARVGDFMAGQLANGARGMRWVPTFWFLGLYQAIQHGGAAPEFARRMSRRADIALALVLLGAMIIYPLAWDRMRRMAVEGRADRRAKPERSTDGIAHRAIRSPQERAVFHFIGQTMARNGRYQVYMAIYFGVGIALAISCATKVRIVEGLPELGLSTFGLHAVMPLLVFWAIAGLKMAFGFPLQLHASWIFRSTGAPLEKCITASRKWAFTCGFTAVIAVTTVLVFIGWNTREVLVQTVCGTCLCAILIEGFLFAQTSVPFSQPRRPGRTSLPLILTLYLGVLAPFIFGMIFLEMIIETTPSLLLAVVLAVPIAHLLAQKLRQRAVLIEEEREGADGEFQLLGLCGDLSS